ncbi:MAG TPA: glycosyltransferase [Ignavibacteria bacterium]|nr:glycosyltransferase [Ignavibacteria bacterium]
MEKADTSNNVVQPIAEGTKRPLWSVMIPSYNPDINYLKETINSILVQDPGQEIMQIRVVDDCSPDIDVEKIIKENWGSRIEFYKQPVNIGHSFNFTECIRQSKGKYIHIIHTDDKVAEGFYSRFEKMFESNPEIGAAFCRQEYIDDYGNHLFDSELEMEESGIFKDALIKLAEKQRIQYCSMVVKRSVYEQVGGFIRKNIGCEDWEMWVRIASKVEIGYIIWTLAQYRIHKSSMTGNDKRTGKDIKDLREAADIFTKYLPEKKREEVSLIRNRHYSVYSFNNAKSMYEEFNDEEGAAAQLNETILLNSGTVYENIDFLSKFNIPVKGTGVSVIINCRNDEDLIEITLRSLVNQKVPKYIPWEVIVIDNESSDNTVKKASDTWNKYRSRTPFRIIQLNNSSVYEARKSAVRSAEFNFIVFCNPGNLLNTDYIETVSGKMMQNMEAGAIGGITEELSKIKLPEWFKEHSNYIYQIGEQFEYAGDLTWAKGYLWNSGMAIRKVAWNMLEKKNFKSLTGDIKDKVAIRIIDAEICLALRIAGWKIIYTFDLRLKNFITEADVSWKLLRKLYRLKGEKSVIIFPYLKFRRNELESFSELPKRKLNRKLIKTNILKLRKFKLWKLLSYSENLYGDQDILKIEFILGVLAENIKLEKSSNKQLKILKKYAGKKELGYLKHIIENRYFRYPQYRIKKFNDTRGISVILNYTNLSPGLLFSSLENISLQKIYKEFNWEVIIISSFIKDDTINDIEKLWFSSGCKAELRFMSNSLMNRTKLKIISCEISRYDYLIFLNETDFINENYLRIAHKILCKSKDVGILGGQTEAYSNVKPPKWFDQNKEHYSVGKIAEKSMYINDHEHHLWNSGLVARKSALKDSLNNGLILFNNNGSDILKELPYDPDLETNIKLSGWKILYEERLKLRHFIPVKKLNWEYLRKIYRYKGNTEILESSCLNALIDNAYNSNINSWIHKAGTTLNKITKYSVRKIFSEAGELKGDTEVLEIEKLKGNLSELIRSKNTYGKLAREYRKRINGSNRLMNGRDVRDTVNGKQGVSIVICCYNSVDILPLTLQYIFKQNVPQHIPWEIIIVDNASKDNTQAVAKKEYESSNCLTHFKIVNEPVQGLSSARRKGFDTAEYEYVVFCDDDNLLEKKFVSLVYEIMSNHAEIGVLGGQGKSEFDISPASWFNEWKNSFAVGKQAEYDGDITWSRGYVWGASMVVRKEAWKKLLSGGFKSILTDRKGNSLSAGGDTEICYALRNAGWKIWYDSRLKYKHHLPIERLDWMYLRKLFRGFGQASAGLDVYLKESPKPFRNSNRKLIPKSKRFEIHKTLSILKKTRYEKLLSFKRKREGDTDIPMLEYCLGRIEGLLKTRGTYNKGIKLLKKAARKKDLKYLSTVFRDYSGKFPRYKIIKKLNGVSVIVCTYNGAERLSDTIRHLALQKVDKNILWEVIFVDNASTDNSKEVTINEWRKHKSNARLKITDQPVPGKQLALEKGYEVASYEYLITCDDDNWLDENFVQLTYEILSSNENIGIFV